MDKINGTFEPLLLEHIHMQLTFLFIKSVLTVSTLSIQTSLRVSGVALPHQFFLAIFRSIKKIGQIGNLVERMSELM